MVKILIYSPLALENGRGGEISSIELAAGLNKYYNISLVHTNIFIGKKLLNKKLIEEKLNGVKIKNRMNFATLHISNLVFIFPYPLEIIKFYRLIKKNDIIYTSFSTFKESLMFMIFSLLHRRGRFIVGYRKPLHSEKAFSLYNLKYRLSILLFSLYKRRIYHHALSENAKKFLEKFYVPNRVIHIIHGIDLTKYKNESSIVKSQDVLSFIYIGYLDDIHKGIKVLVEAVDEFLKEYKDLKIFFEFCGMGPLESKIKLLEMKYPKNVRFHGYVSNEIISDYYKRGDVFLFTSRVEPFPRALMEALGAGLLIICSKTIGSVELLKGKEFAFFIRKLASDSIKQRIKELYDFWNFDPKKFRELQGLAKEFVFKNYSFERELEAFTKFFERIMKENN
ncbi:MAG: glycosyltransferase family 4 protein [Candidatus Hermodarchaeota archaeon]